jgi:hypothetical protein
MSQLENYHSSNAFKIELSIQELHCITKLLLHYLVDRECKTICFSNTDSYYQKVWHADRNLYQTPTFTLGILDESIERLKKLMYNNDYVPNCYDFQLLGSVLTALGAIMHKLPYGADEPLHTAEVLTVDELSQIITILLQAIENAGYETISFKEKDSYYQKIAHADRTFEHTPTIRVGYLDEDMQHLKELLCGRAPVDYDFERLGAIFTTWGAICKIL